MLLYAFISYAVYAAVAKITFLRSVIKTIPVFKHIVVDRKPLEYKEKLDSYWRCILDDDREWSIIEERDYREKGLRMLLDWQLHNFERNRLGRCQMEGIHCYDLLKNPFYYNAFAYFSRQKVLEGESRILDGNYLGKENLPAPTRPEDRSKTRNY